MFVAQKQAGGGGKRHLAYLYQMQSWSSLSLRCSNKYFTSLAALLLLLSPSFLLSLSTPSFCIHQPPTGQSGVVVNKRQIVCMVDYQMLDGWILVWDLVKFNSANPLFSEWELIRNAEGNKEHGGQNTHTHTHHKLLIKHTRGALPTRKSISCCRAAACQCRVCVLKQ